MKKLKLMACLAVLTISTKAQYFQGKYAWDTNLGGRAMNGMVTQTTGAGHLIGGLMVKEKAPSPTLCIMNSIDWGLLVTRTDEAGGFSMPGNFNKTYLFQDGSGNQIRLSSGQVLEYSDGSGYGAIFSYYLYVAPSGTCVTPTLTDQGVGFARLDASGNVLSTAGFRMPSTGYSTYVHDIRESIAQPGDIFACGEWQSTAGPKFWALRITQGGSLVWGNTYHNTGEIARSIMEDPYDTDYVIIAGSTPVPGSSDMDGLVVVLNAGSGAVSNVMGMTGSVVDYFNSIDVSNDPAKPGFILSGYADSHAYLAKLTPTLSPTWARLYRPASHPFSGISSHDAKGRLNTSGVYEYYMTGPCGNDAFIFKINSLGTPMFPGAFFYDTGLSAEETTNSVDVNTSGTYDGVSIYGVVEAPGSSSQREAYIAKSYFNGYTACSYTREGIVTIPVTLKKYQVWLNTTSLSGDGVSFLSEIDNNHRVLCNLPSVTGGSNARPTVTGIAAEESEGVNRIFPNPLNPAAALLTVNIPSSKDENVTVAIRNMLGQLVFSKEAHLNAGSISLDLREAALSHGVYEVGVETSENTYSSKLVVDLSK